MPEENLELKLTREGEGRKVELLPHGKPYEELVRALLAQKDQEG